MAKIEKCDEKTVLVFDQAECEILGIESGMNANFTRVDCFYISFTLTKDVSESNMQAFCTEITTAIKTRPWINYTYGDLALISRKAYEKLNSEGYLLKLMTDLIDEAG